MTNKETLIPILCGVGIVPVSLFYFLISPMLFYFKKLTFHFTYQLQSSLPPLLLPSRFQSSTHLRGGKAFLGAVPFYMLLFAQDTELSREDRVGSDY